MKNLFFLCFGLFIAGCAANPETLQNQNLSEIDTQLMVLDLQNHDPAAARLHLQEAQALAANDPQVLVAAGYFDEAMGDQSLAVSYYERAIELAPKDPEIENAYGAFLYRQANYQQALPYFEQASADPENAIATEADENAGLTAEKLQEPSLAQTYFTKAKAGD